MKTAAVKGRTGGGWIKPALAVLGVGVIILGSFVVGRFVWLGGGEIFIGVIALVALAARPKSATYAAIVLGIAMFFMWLLAVAIGLMGWLSSLTFIGAIAFVIAAAVAHRSALPSASRSGADRTLARRPAKRGSRN
jgi:hypothetical protein